MINSKYTLEGMPIVSRETVGSLIDIVAYESRKNNTFIADIKKKISREDPIIAILIKDLGSLLTYEALSRQSASIKLEEELSAPFQINMSDKERECCDLRKSILEIIRFGRHGRYTKEGLPKISMKNYLSFIETLIKNKNNIAKYFGGLEEIFERENPILYNSLLKNDRKNLSLCTYWLIRRQIEAYKMEKELE